MCNLFKLFKRKKKYEPIINPEAWSIGEWDVLSLINDYRNNVGLKMLYLDGNLHRFARIRSKEISENFSHDGLYKHLKDITYLGLISPKENLAFGYETTFGIVEEWKESPTHNKVLLSKSKYAGVGYFNKNGKGYYCLILAR